MTLKKGIVWSQRKMRPQKVRVAGKLNPIMQKVMSNKKIAKALDQPRERKEFFGMIKNLSRDGVYKGELRKLFGDLRSGKVRSRTINAKEIRTIAKEFFPDSAKRYSFKESRPQKNTPAPEQNSAMFDEIRRGFSSSGGTQTESNPPRNAASFRYGKTKPADHYSPEDNLKHEFAKPQFSGKNRANSSGLIAKKSNTAPPEEKKTKPVGNYSPEDSLKYEFAKPGFQSEKKLEKKKDTEIKPVAPEAYAKTPGTPQKTTETSDETSTASPEVTKTKPVGNYSPLDDRLRYEFEKPDSSETGSANSSSENIFPNTPEKMAAIMNKFRKDSPDSENSSDSTKKRGGFLGALGAVARNKRN